MKNTEHVADAQKKLAQAIIDANGAEAFRGHAEKALRDANVTHFMAVQNVRLVDRILMESVQHFAGIASDYFAREPRNHPFAELFGKQPAEIVVVLADLEKKADAAKRELDRAEEEARKTAESSDLCGRSVVSARLALRNAIRIESALPPIELEPTPEPVMPTQPATLNDVVAVLKSIEQKFQLADCAEGK